MAKRVQAGNPKQAVAYIRVSTSDQSLGPEAQRGQIEAWAKREGIEIVSFHVDQGVSGGAQVADRPAMLEAIGVLAKSGAGLFVVAKRDRLARDIVIAASGESIVGSYGGRVVSADGMSQGDGPEAGLMRAMIDAFAQYERALIRSRTKSALAVKKGRGELAGNVPFAKSLDENRGLTANPQEASTMDRVKVLRSDGASVRSIVKTLESEGYASRTGRPYSKGSVENLLRKLAA